MKYLLAFLVVATVTSGAGCQRPPATPKEVVSNQGLELTLEALGAPGPASNWILKATLRNNSAHLRFWVNGLIGSRSAVSLSLRDSAGRVDDSYMCKEDSGNAGHDYVVLRPDEELRSEVGPLECYFMLPGRYTVVAKYKDRGILRPAQPVGVTYFAGEVISNPVIVEVTKGTTED